MQVISLQLLQTASSGPPGPTSMDSCPRFWCLALTVGTIYLCSIGTTIILREAECSLSAKKMPN